ncbi:unnamed protein product [Dibothriocephalus latus]|uniref:Uncharacterized protein n=1 Tax=Dibothriocephalus latus TaxID=60516 RepID=A0A3P7MJ50_DIBLA|nr:unnamed protein product [Dibothriocephalus latus]
MPLITIVSGNSMLYFLVSNLMTGSLNLLIDTLELGDLRPVWLSNACQFCLLTAYVVISPLATDFLRRRVLGILP